VGIKKKKKETYYSSEKYVSLTWFAFSFKILQKANVCNFGSSFQL